MNAKVQAPALAVTRSRVADYVELTKPRIAVMVLFTVAIGGCLAGPADGELATLLHAVLATALVAASGSALNQFAERHRSFRQRSASSAAAPS